MTGRIAILMIVVAAIAAGVGLYYTQVYAYYDEIPAEVAEVKLTAIETGEAVPVGFENYKGIDSDSSPIRFRACFELGEGPDMLAETFQRYDAEPVPLVAPGWFDCFDAAEIGADLEAGTAVAFLGTTNEPYGIDRVVAAYEDGRAYEWTQINHCGEVVFDGDPAPEDCPPAPEGVN
ncbi:DUF6446 family protein [Pelagovum pacificum]|uniref:Histidine kinase n=1 Tax=Pelagovum pacificum TaxID=2588711 RepID=A0A5C5GEE5_9RHOB|nr:DUF6446 family protein [Pelagovum pacificum]QQA43717.1 histidine kinase [Pelagovum pacificum]TNY33152.1 histidine kinase [Pelagovum pacificum]